MYTSINFKSKKQLKEAVASGKTITIFQPNDIFGNPASKPDFTGKVTLEGPHYPEPHKWYATAQIVNGKVVSVK